LQSIMAYSRRYAKRKKRKEKFTLFSDHNGSLLRRQPGEICQNMILRVCR